MRRRDQFPAGSFAVKCWLPPGGRLSDLPRSVEAMGTVSQAVRVYRFGTFAVDVKTGELTNAGRRTPLREQPLQLLLALLERPGELITREELTSRLWPDGTFVDFDRGLNKAMNHLREALSDSAEHPQFIETLPRKGYRFIAPVTQDAQDLEPAARDVPPGRSGIRWWPAVPAAVVAMIGIAIGADVGGTRSWIAGRGGAAPHITSHCRVAARKSLGRSRAGLFRRRDDRCADHGSRQDGQPSGHLPHVDDAIQGGEAGHQGHRAGTECRRGCRGHRHTVG